MIKYECGLVVKKKMSNFAPILFFRSKKKHD